MPTAEDIMSHPVITIPPTKNIQEAAEIMATHAIGCVIVSKDEKVSGILTERDILKKVVAKDLDANKTTASDIMTKDVITVDGRADLFQVNDILDEHGIRRLPVIKEGKVVGIITAKNIIKNLKDIKSRKMIPKEYSRPDFIWKTTKKETKKKQS